MDNGEWPSRKERRRIARENKAESRRWAKEAKRRARNGDYGLMMASAFFADAMLRHLPTHDDYFSSLHAPAKE